MNFWDKAKKFNDMYKLPGNDTPVNLGSNRVENFWDILDEEVYEGLDLIKKTTNDINYGDLDLLTDMSDWLGDLIIYCATEARRWGIPLEQVLDIIMESNFSKLGADGLPIYDERGKVMKGPNYWKPEAKIRELLIKTLEGKKS